MTEDNKNENTESDVNEFQSDADNEQITSEDEELAASFDAEAEETGLETDSEDDDDDEQFEADAEEDDDEQLEAGSEDDDGLDAESDEADEFNLEVQSSGSSVSEEDPAYVDQNQKRLLQSMRLEARIEAVIFASQKPLKVNELAEILGDDDLTDEDIQSTIDQLIQDYENRVGGFTLKYVARMGYQFQTANAAGPIMARMFASRPRPISRAALETLSIIAYRQPVTRAQVEFIRGVDAGSIFKTLMERELVKCVGRKEVVGRPMLFGTTDEFLKVFNLANLKDLPSLESFQPAPEAIQGAKAKLEGDQDIDIEQYISDNTEGDDTSDDNLDDEYSAETSSFGEEDDSNEDDEMEMSEEDSQEGDSDTNEATLIEKSGAIAAADDADDFSDDADELETTEEIETKTISLEGAAGATYDEQVSDESDESDESENLVSSENAGNDNDLKV